MDGTLKFPMLYRNKNNQKKEDNVLKLFLNYIQPYLPSYSFSFNSYILTLFPFLSNFKPYYNFIETFFKCSKYNTTIEIEIFSGVINFFSCLLIKANKVHFNLKGPILKYMYMPAV